MPIDPDRNAHIAAFYQRHAERLRRAITAQTTAVHGGLIDDACAFAWEKLARRRDINPECPRAYWWLYKVALRQAWALGRRQGREVPCGALNGADEDAPEPVALEPDVVDVVADRVERATVREVLGELHWRERRELLLYAHGLTYEQIAAVTGTSLTAVNRWLVRGKRALWEAHSRRSTTHHRRPLVG